MREMQNSAPEGSASKLVGACYSCVMDRQMLKDQLVQAERKLTEVAVRIEKQKALISRLEAGGHDSAHAAFLLQQSLGLQEMHEAHRDRLKRELTKV